MLSKNDEPLKRRPVQENNLASKRSEMLHCYLIYSRLGKTKNSQWIKRSLASNYFLWLQWLIFTLNFVIIIVSSLLNIKFISTTHQIE